MCHRVRPRGTRAALVIALLVASAGCGGSSPAAPASIDLTGDWTGALPFRMPDEDWSLARVSLVQAGSALTGEAASREDVRYPLSGTLSGTGGTLTVEGLPGDSTCASIGLLITRLEFVGGRVERISGQAAGRCYGTVAGAFELRRAAAAF